MRALSSQICSPPAIKSAMSIVQVELVYNEKEITISVTVGGGWGREGSS